MRIWHTHAHQQHTRYSYSSFQDYSFAHTTVICRTLCPCGKYQPFDARPSATSLLIALTRIVTHLLEVGLKAHKRTQGFPSKKAKKVKEVGRFSKHINFGLRFAETFHRRRTPPQILAPCAATLPVWPTGFERALLIWTNVTVEWISSFVFENSPVQISSYRPVILIQIIRGFTLGKFRDNA